MQLNFFMIMLFIIGFYILFISNKLDSLTLGCSSIKLKNSIKSLLIIGTAFMVLSVSYLLFNFNCKCTNTSLSQNFYVGFIFILGILLILTSIVMISESKTEKCKISKNVITSLLTIGISLFLISIIIVFLKIYSLKKLSKKLQYVNQLEMQKL